MIREVEKYALIEPSNLGLLSGFPLLWREGKIGDRVGDAFFEKRQQFIRFIPADQEAPIKEGEFFVNVVAQRAELVDLKNLPKDETGEDTGGMTGTWGDVLIRCHRFSIICGDNLFSFDFYGHVHEYQFFSRGLEGPA